MKSNGSFLLIILTFFTSCSNHLDLVDQIEPIPVIYLLMNPDDTIFNLTLTRTFAGKSNAFDMARDEDIVFYDSVDIRLEAWIDEFKVQEVLFKPSESVKNPGLFSKGPGYCYEAPNEFHDMTEPGTTFRIVLKAPGLTTPIVARIPVITAAKPPTRYNHVIGLYPNGYKYPPEKKQSPRLKKYSNRQ